jgi:56kDa selenium binding protein (SBP56)
MRNVQWATLWAAMCLTVSAEAASVPASSGHYMFACSGAVGGKGEDFIAVIDANPDSPHYGELVTSAASGIVSQQVHHTEYWMPDSAQLFVFSSPESFRTRRCP